MNTHRRGQSDDVLYDFVFCIKKSWLNYFAAFRVREFFSKERMFIGFEMSHAAPQSLYERQAGIAVGDPSITGVWFFIFMLIFIYE